MLRELALPDGGFASSQDADTDGVEGLTFTWTAEEGVPEELLQPLRARPLGDPRPARPELARTAVRAAGAAAEARPRRQGGRVVERVAARGARRGWAAAGAGGLARRGSGSRSSCSGRSPTTRVACTAPGERASGAPGSSPTTRTSRNGLLELHVATGELRWLEEANRLARLAVELFADEERGGFFLSAERSS